MIITNPSARFLTIFSVYTLPIMTGRVKEKDACNLIFIKKTLWDLDPGPRNELQLLSKNTFRVFYNFNYNMFYKCYTCTYCAYIATLYHPQYGRFFYNIVANNHIHFCNLLDKFLGQISVRWYLLPFLVGGGGGLFLRIFSFGGCKSTFGENILHLLELGKTKWYGKIEPIN